MHTIHGAGISMQNGYMIINVPIKSPYSPCYATHVYIYDLDPCMHEESLTSRRSRRRSMRMRMRRRGGGEG